MKNNAETAIAPTTEKSGTSAVAKNAIRPLVLQGSAEDLEQSDIKVLSDLSTRFKGTDLAKLAVASVNMVPDYLKFDDLQNVPIGLPDKTAPCGRGWATGLRPGGYFVRPCHRIHASQSGV